MTPEQREAHQRLLSALPVRSVGEFPEAWPERDRPLSPEELPYLLTNQEAA